VRAVTAISGADPGSIVGGALAGAALLAVPGAIWATFLRLGGSDAYRQTFVNDDVDELNVVSLHTSDRAEADRAFARLFEPSRARGPPSRFGRQHAGVTR
jgi:hypothetical protein